MKLLILGGTGFVSGRLAELALSQGHEVWAVTRGCRPAPEGVRMLRADRNDAQALLRALREEGVRFDAALDCICFNAAHAEADLTVLPAFTRRIVVISTDSVYHPAHKTVPQAEETDVYLTDGGYGANKRLMELTFLQDAAHRLRWTILRPGHIFGPGSELGCFPEQSRQPELLSLLRSGQPMRLVGGGQYLIHPVYVDDLCRVMLDCVNEPRTENRVFCIGGPDILPNRRYYEILGELLRVPVTIESIPEEGYLEAHPQASGHLCHRAYDLSALSSAGIRLPDTSLAAGLAAQIAWLTAQGR